jgi:uncharacterized protein (TIRG00374 family)
MKTSGKKLQPYRTWGRRLSRLILAAAPIPLLWWTFRQAPLTQAWKIIKEGDLVMLAAWLAINLGIVVLMTGRWWLVLNTLGYPLPYLSLTRYRLAAFAISYFTPGPQFGGEPWQVYILNRRHNIPGRTGTASVSLDKLLELIANFSFLVLGTAIALANTWLQGTLQGSGMLLAAFLLAFPLAYLILMLTGQRPLCWITNRLPKRISQAGWIKMLCDVESEMSTVCIQYPATIISASFVSAAVWGCLIFEYGYMISLLGLKLTPPQVISALFAARVALLTPLPGGLGALEASQLIAFQALGLSPAYGISTALLIRARDLIFGSAGLLLLASLLGRHPSWRFWKIKDV